MIGSPEKAFARATISAAGFWAFLEFVYWRIQNFMGGSFSVMGGLAPPGQFHLATGIYFIFVTITTLGISYITPLSPVSRGIAVTEASSASSIWLSS